MIKWAIAQELYDEKDISSLNEIDERLISLAYKLGHDEKISGTHYATIITEEGTEKDIEYDGYFNESYEESMNRLNREIDISLNENVLENEAFTEMATIGGDEELGIRVQVNPDRSKEGVPYFKVFNDTKIKVGETKVGRFHFTDDKMEYHNDKYLDWDITNDDIKNIHIFMSKKNKKQPAYTNWQVACYKWNEEYGFMLDKEEEYFNGELDEEFINHPSYVPSTTEIPDTWNTDFH